MSSAVSLLPPFLFAESSDQRQQEQQHQLQDTNSNLVTHFTNPLEIESEQNNKIVIITFDDQWKSQYSIAKPILDQFGFKGTFFVACEDVGKNVEGERMSWNDIKQMQNEGHDIQSHSMTHGHLNNMTLQEITYEIDQSKQCLLNQGINSTVFAYPFNEGSHNSTIVKAVSKVYTLARSGDEPLIYLQCNGWGFISSQQDCRPFFENGTLTFVNRYSLPGWTHKSDASPLNRTQMFQHFAEIINKQTDYNIDKVNAFPILVYHDIVSKDIAEYRDDTFNIDENLFFKEMKYLYDNNFRVITMSDLGYDKCSNQLYIKDNFTEPNDKCDR